MVNVSQIVKYKEQVKGQKKEEGKLVKIEGVEEWEVEKILNKKKIRGVEKILNTVEGIYSRGGYMGKERKLKEHRRNDKRI